MLGVERKEGGGVARGLDSFGRSDLLPGLLRHHYVVLAFHGGRHPVAERGKGHTSHRTCGKNAACRLIPSPKL